MIKTVELLNRMRLLSLSNVYEALNKSKHKKHLEAFEAIISTAEKCRNTRHKKLEKKEAKRQHD